MLNSHVSDLTIDEFKFLIRETVEQTLTEFLADPDKGLELRRSIRTALERSVKAVREGGKIYSAESVAKDLGLEQSMRQLQFTAEAKADLARLDKSLVQQVIKKLHWLTENFDAIVPEPLTGDWKGVYKLRIGDYRALYTFDSIHLVVHFVRHRREVYKTK